MFETLTDGERITLAKAKMDKVADHFLHLIALHENNALVVFSPMLASQIPRSYAANAFNVFRYAMHDFEVVRLCALWDCPQDEKDEMESIPTVFALIEPPSIIAALAEETRAHHADIPSASATPAQVTALATDSHFGASEIEAAEIRMINAEFGDRQAAKAKTELVDTIETVKNTLSDPRLAGLRNYRDKHLAHSLASTRRERRGPIPPPKRGYADTLFNCSSPIVERLYCWVNGTSFSMENSRGVARDYAEALWRGCRFTVER